MVDIVLGDGTWRGDLFQLVEISADKTNIEGSAGCADPIGDVEFSARRAKRRDILGLDDIAVDKPVPRARLIALQ